MNLKLDVNKEDEDINCINYDLCFISLITYLSLPLTSSNILAIYIPVIPRRIIQKKGYCDIIPAVPGTYL